MKLAIYTFLVILSLSAIVSWLWVQAIDNIKNKHSDYKGEDLFNEDESDTRI